MTLEQFENKLRELKIPEDKLEGFVHIVTEGIELTLFEEISAITDDKEFSEWEEKIKSTKSDEHYATILQDMATKAFGDKAKEELTKLYDELFTQLIETAKETGVLLKKYEAGDPETVAKLDAEAAKEN